jgi:hypothetical protein
VEGDVFVTEGDVAAAARLLGMEEAAFVERYVRRTKSGTKFNKPRDGRQCHFLEGGGCRIHEAKPTQCRLFPFWPELVENRDEWEKAARRCPGIGKGELIQIGTALEIASEMRVAYPETYDVTPGD